MILQDLSTYEVVLASQSPRRQELLSKLDIEFRVFDSKMKEDVPSGLPVQEIASQLARQKADFVFQSYKSDKPLIVIGGDTIVTLDNQIMGKPVDRTDAIRMLNILSGKRHFVISGLCVMTESKTLVDYDEAQVTFHNLPEDDILYYVDNYNPYDKAGAYGIQEWIGYRGIERIEGSFYTVMGFPTHLLWNMLERAVADNKFDFKNN